MESVNTVQKNKIRGLKPGHVIHTLFCEHEVILGFLDKLEEINRTIQGMSNYEDQREEFSKLVDIAEHLIEAEPHHQREEEVLFPELEKRDILCPPEAMRAEHKDLREKKKELLEISKNINRTNYNDFKKRLNKTGEFIVFNLRDHISKENDILYPIALQVINEAKTWSRMKSDCDKIGYCCFTPKV